MKKNVVGDINLAGCKAVKVESDKWLPFVMPGQYVLYSEKEPVKEGNLVLVIQNLKGSDWQLKQVCGGKLFPVGLSDKEIIGFDRKKLALCCKVKSVMALF